MPSMSTFLLLLLLTLLLSLLQISAAAIGAARGAARANHGSKQTYIVRVRSDLKPSVFTDVDLWYASTLRTLSDVSTTNNERRDDRGPLDPLHVYRTVFHGFSAVLTPAEADLLRLQPEVLAVIPDRRRRLHTTRSPQFLGLLTANSRPSSLLSSVDSGSSLVIAVLDTGIRPDHQSFSDAGIPPPPRTWKGACESGPKFPATSCNRKLVGARFFSLGHQAAARNRTSYSDVLSPFDSEGHGTHTASSAAGVSVPNASFLDLYAPGVASGIAPKARIAAYKVCWSSGCFDSDILAAIDRAVADGADIISLSIGAGPAPYHLDPIAIGSFGAVEQGVLFSASAGNDGPGEMTVTNVAPWITTVGAGTIDRRFPADVVLGDGTVFNGESLYVDTRNGSQEQWLPLVYGGNASASRVGFRSLAPFCMRGTLDPALVRGKVVFCERGGIARVEKGVAVMEAGGGGVIVANQFLDGEGVVPDAHLLPAVSVGYSAGRLIQEYLHTSSEPRVRMTFHGTQVGVKPAPVVASFSGRGPNTQSPYIIKPDVIAPGVGILAAWTNGVAPTGLASDPRRTQFNVLSGTSMACPHVSGMAALLKAAHPDWSPAAIRSAMMTRAYVSDNLGEEIIDENSGNRSTPWAHGSGHIDPEKAVDPGIVYDMTVEDYLAFLCSNNYTETALRTLARRPVNCSAGSNMPWDINYPSISVVLKQPEATKLEATVHRTLTSVADGSSTYAVSVTEPQGVKITVEPQALVFPGKGSKQEFVARILADGVKLPPGRSRTEFGSLTWNDGRHAVRSPVAVTWQQSFSLA